MGLRKKLKERIDKYKRLRGGYLEAPTRIKYTNKYYIRKKVVRLNE